MHSHLVTLVVFSALVSTVFATLLVSTLAKTQLQAIQFGYLEAVHKWRVRVG